MQNDGVGENQVSQVRGYADQRLRKKDPFDPSNRRISLIVQYINKDKGDEDEPDAKGKEKGKEGTAEAPKGELPKEKPAPEPH